jgi:antitoxin HicB
MARALSARKHKKSRRNPFKPVTYTVTDGKLVLVLETCEEGGYCITCPFDPGLTTEAETLEEAFEMARDAAEALRESRRMLAESPRPSARRRSRH